MMRSRGHDITKKKVVYIYIYNNTQFNIIE